MPIEEQSSPSFVIPCAERPHVPQRSKNGARVSRAQDLARILEMISSSPSARAELVADIRAQVRNGSYLNEEKLNLAIYRLLRDILE